MYWSLSLVNDIGRGVAAGAKRTLCSAKAPARMCRIAAWVPPLLRQGGLAHAAPLAAQAKQYALPLVLALVLAGCAVGPHFHPPSLPRGASYTLQPTAQPSKVVWMDRVAK